MKKFQQMKKNEMGIGIYKSPWCDQYVCNQGYSFYKDGIIIERIDCAKKLVEKYDINYSTLKYKLQNNKCVINGIDYHYET